MDCVAGLIAARVMRERRDHAIGVGRGSGGVGLWNILDVYRSRCTGKSKPLALGRLHVLLKILFEP